MQTIRLENKLLLVELFSEKPVIKSYVHKSTGSHIGGAGDEGILAVNGETIPWKEWNISVSIDKESNTAVYELNLLKRDLSLKFEFQLQGNALLMNLKDIEDPGRDFKTIEWIDLPLIACKDWEYAYWREDWHQTDWQSYAKGLYGVRFSKGYIKYALPDPCPKPTVHTCFFKDNLCCFVYSNYSVLPLVNQLVESKRYPGRCERFAISLNAYQYHVRNETMTPLQAKIIFLTDINDDQKADECDYRLWLNRQFPDPDPIYKECIWYKLSCVGDEGETITTFDQALEIIEAIHNITDGLPQIMYLVRWQYKGYDTPYPPLDYKPPSSPTLECSPGTKEDLLKLFNIAKKRFNCTVSYHINVDEAFKENPGWDESIICRDVDGALINWGLSNGKMVYHISHTKQVESGKIFNRIKAMMNLVPVEKTIHPDAFRNTNCSWEPDGYIGPVEELECGMKPIIEFFKSKGVDASTEGPNGMPIEYAGVFSAFWHMDSSLEWIQMYHGKILGGGLFRTDLKTWGRGASMDNDMCYSKAGTKKNKLMPPGFKRFSYQENWDDIVDIIYLGSMLYRFYLEREMVEVRCSKGVVKIRFSDDVQVVIDENNNHLKVIWGDVLIAEDYDRFIPLGDAIYAYSRSGCERAWRLPEDWKDIDFKIFSLNRKGRGPTPQYKLEKDRIWIKLLSHAPVKLVRNQRDSYQERKTFQK